VVVSISEWQFRDFLDGRGTNVIRAWTVALPPVAQAKLDMIILVLQAANIWPWPAQYISTLRGYEGILELRVGSSGVQYRPLGCYGPGRREFTILIGSVEKGGRLPKSDCGTAVERRKVILEDRGRTCEHDFGQGTTSREV
jgi:hypothetical protein